MEYRRALERLYDLRQFAYEPGIDRTVAILSELDDPHHNYETVQIAGTNGKGSAAAMTASILQAAGYSVGLYTSPHLEDVRERIRVDGRRITKAAIGRFMDRTETFLDDAGADGSPPTFFEGITAMALWYFDERDVDIAILEVGIGGRYDATSVVDPDAAAITSVDLEHTDLLGSSRSEIATDMVAVAPDTGPFVTGASGEALTAIEETTSPVTVGDRTDADVIVRYDGLDDHLEAHATIEDDTALAVTLPLLGPAQSLNAGVAATLCRSGWAVTDEDIAQGIHGVEWPGRTEIAQREPLVMLDGAHNPAAGAALTQVIEELPHETVHLVLGIMEDKPVADIVDALPTPTTAVACQPTVQRSAPVEVVATALERTGVSEVTRERGVEAALERALERAGPDACVLVTGSLYTVGEARRRYSRYVLGRPLTSTADVASRLGRADIADTDIERFARSGSHETIHLQLRERQAALLEEELLRVGGECVTAGDGSTAGALVDVVCMATTDEYDRLIAALDARSAGVAGVATALRSHLSLEDDSDAASWPWERDPVIMGVLNVTPDSFHDGGEYLDPTEAIERARAMVDAGAGIIDVGGESTRPGGDPIDAAIELDRVRPVIDGLSGLEVPISIDTRKASVARECLAAGADLINDVSGLSDPAMPRVAAETGAPLILMHSQSTPVDPTVDPEYDDVVADVAHGLHRLVQRCRSAGIDRDHLILDPGIGFGKTPSENFELLDRLEELAGLGFPLLVGHSHKSLFSQIDRGPEDRLAPTIAGTALAVDRGADIVRVHDVEENLAALETALTRRTQT